MGKIMCLMGKSCSGKDTIYKHLCADGDFDVEILVPYTTRPIRSNEVEGGAYHFVDEAGYETLKAQGVIAEERAYDTVHGIWRYFTVIDDEFINSDKNYLYIGTLEAYVSLSAKIGKDNIIPIYIECDDGDRLERALKRERKQSEPKYAEMCRRFLADTEDFSDERLAAAGITKRFDNSDLEECLENVKGYIGSFS